MNFRRVEPLGPAQRAVECYWMVEDTDTTPVKQKIIPDGFTEIIFHYGDHYRINLEDKWEKQATSLLAGQITRHFYLENTGATDIIGIKLKPAAAAHLFGVKMNEITDKVIPFDKLKPIKELKDIELIDKYFNDLCVDYPHDHIVDTSLAMIFSKHGMISVNDICKELSITDRYLQQLFRKYVGLSPKFFARIIRFGYIFQVIKEKSPDWASVVYEAGYYDQSHFIRNFKAFTGEDPTEYIFAEKSLANFFMKK